MRRRLQNGWRRTGRRQRRRFGNSAAGSLPVNRTPGLPRKKWVRAHPQFQFDSLENQSITRKKEKRRGRPKTDEPVDVVYVHPVCVDHRR